MEVVKSPTCSYLRSCIIEIGVILLLYIACTLAASMGGSPLKFQQMEKGLTKIVVSGRRLVSVLRNAARLSYYA